VRIATWNVNSLAARLDKVWWWLDRARPDVLLLQETKLGDDDAPHQGFTERGYRLAHHGEGRWNGVAIASRVGLDDVVVNFGDGPVPATSSAASSDGAPLAEARMVSAVCNGVRVVSLYAPNGRAVGTVFYQAKLAWFARLQRWLAETRAPSDALVLGGDYNIAPGPADVWDEAAVHGGTHVSPEERDAFSGLVRWGLVDAYRAACDAPGRYTWWDYRAGCFHKTLGMRIDHVLVTEPLRARLVWAEIDREARKGKPTPSDHAPLLIDLDEAGAPIDAGWKGAEERIAARRRPPR
jgi:exodeoxyribonuclease-3